MVGEPAKIRMGLVRRFPHWLLVLLVCFSLNLQAAIESRIDHRVIEQGETVRLWLDMAGINPDKINLDALEQDFEILNRSQQSSTIIRNGQVERATELVLTLLPKQTGSLTIPAIEIDGEQTRAHPIVVRAVKQVSAAEGGFDVLSTLSSEQPRVQQPIIYQATLLVGQQIFNATIKAPSIKTGKALIEPLGEQKQYKQTLKGREIMVVEQTWMITPEQSGPLEISPVQLTGQIQSGRAKRNPFSNSSAMKRVQVAAKPYQLMVAPIPNSYTGRTWLPAENLTLSDDWNSETFTQTFTEGEPITRTITLHAEGLSSNQLPELMLPDVDGIKQYAAAPVSDQQFSDVLASTLTLEVTLIPTRAGELMLPEVRIPWWDVKNNREQVAVLAAKMVTVLAGAQAPQKPQLEKQNQAAGQLQAQPSLTPPALNPSGLNPPSSDETNDHIASVTGTPAEAEKHDSAQPKLSAEVLDGWWLVLIGAALGCGLTLLAVRLSQKRAQQSVIAERKDLRPNDLKKNLRLQLKALMQACDSNDATAARAALLVWGKTVLPDCANLNQLSLQVDPELKQAIMDLNQHSYGQASGDEGRDSSSWKGELLWSAVQAFNPQDVNQKALEKVGLEPLYQS
ncbi:MAG: BatD family protein [Amphritea sp.]